ncbi:hypothetical protein HYH03_000084 [Edaphochlamys debaryana]|uniref:RNA helicase n=1 Tax=Edaphochlamys debaryana TaxID=47281 RepID=A0A836C735_9CHLO|nr:hypothetical protein HYH03_000084 [Edaphochlamys debaryana]|eukprot:KAG2501579.1 hypothetical protein HYH03_000084 [Edaphochlamys debaryana]
MGRSRSRSRSPSRKKKDKKDKKDKREKQDFDREYDRGYRERSPSERDERRDRGREDYGRSARDKYGSEGRDRERYREYPGGGDARSAGRGGDDRDYRDRDVGRDRERDRDRDRERDRERDSHKEGYRDGGSERRTGDEHEASGKRRREDSAAPSQTGGLAGDVALALGVTAEAVAAGAAPGLSAEEAAQQRRDAESAALEAQAERRRKAVEEWRKKRMAEQGVTEPPAQAQTQQPAQPETQEAAEGAAQGEGGERPAGEAGAEAEGAGARAEGEDEGAPKPKGWSLEDDDEDDGGGGGEDTDMVDANADGGGDGEDGDHLPPPLPAIKREQEDDDDDDPLDAFMGGIAARAHARPTPAKPLPGAKALAGVKPLPGRIAPAGGFIKKGIIVAASGAAGAAGSGAAAAAAKPEGKPEGLKQEPGAEAQEAGKAEAAKPRRKWGTVAAAAPAAAAGDDEVDPLDAFMAAEVMPEVEKLAQQEAERRAASEARELSPGPGAGPGPAAAGDAAAMDVDGAAAEPEVKQEPGDGLPGPSSRLSPPPVAGPSARSNGAAAGASGRASTPARRKPRAAFKRRQASSDEDSSDGSDAEDDEEAEMDDAEWARLVTSGKLSKGDRLVAVDHSTITYLPFRKNFYIEVTELSRLSETELTDLRKELDGIKCRGKNIPAPIRSWTQAGLNTRILEVLRKRGFDRPLPIQAQALPIIMSGRDCIGIAKTGSGKTGAFVLPMMRHVKDQPPLQQGDGPVSLVIAPTRELVAQIAKEAKSFAKPLGLNALAVFGGSGVANQISELKRGVEIVACTPGRMIDLLVTSNGKITNLRRVTYLVLDEADRMFDMGFEPQITRIVQNIRPDRQTVMFSATFPRAVEALARKILNDPVEIQVGGRSVVNTSITQFVEIRPEKERFHRLLEILGEWYDKGKILIFVDKQESCDNLFRDLLRYGYPCLSLHGGKDQSDRESTIADFKGAVCNILVATSIAARGLDVKDLVLVINYDVPNHHEDYVHRVGRTGRAGASGTAITFIGPDEERYAPDLVKALRESGAGVPQDLQTLAEGFHTKHKAGLVKAHGSGYGGSGFKFDTGEEERFRVDKKAKAKAMGLEVEGEDDAEEAALDAAVAALDSTDDIRPAAAKTGTGGAGGGGGGGPVNPMDSVSAVVAAAREKLAEAAKAGLIQMPAGGLPAQGAAAAPAPAPAPPAPFNPLLAAAQQVAAKLTQNVTGLPPPPAVGGYGAPMAAGGPGSLLTSDALARAAAIAAKFGGTIGLPGAAAAAAAGPGRPGHSGLPPQPQGGFEVELEINDFPQHARWKITHRETMNQINELTGAALTVRGTFVPPGRPVPEGERKLFLLIEGPTEGHVKKAKAEIKKILEETTEKVMRRDAPAAGRYSVM